MKCSVCGKINPKINNFCSKCGSVLVMETKENDPWECIYCDKEFKTKKEADKHELTCAKNSEIIKFPYNSNPKIAWIVLWITTMVAFAITVFVNSKSLPQGFNIFDKKWFLSLFFGNIGLGVLAFFAMFFSGNKTKNKETPSILKYSLIICVTYFLINTFLPASVSYSMQGQKLKSDYLKYQTPTITLTPTSIPTISPTTPKPKTQTSNTNNNQGNQIECIGPDGKHFNTSMTECKNLADKWGKTVDYMIICDIPPECGGGSKRVPNSECTTCKRTTANSNNTNSTNTSNYVMVALYGDMPVWCKPEVVQALKDMEVTMREKSKLWADTCVSVVEPPSSCIYLKDEANRTEDAYKNTFMHNCVNNK